MTLDLVGISAEDMADHMFYDAEVVEFSKDVSYIVLVPPRNLVCSIQSQNSPMGKFFASASCGM